MIYAVLRLDVLSGRLWTVHRSVLLPSYGLLRRVTFLVDDKSQSVNDVWFYTRVQSRRLKSSLRPLDLNYILED